MKVFYPDTSFLLALKAPHERAHQAAVKFFEREQEEVWLWSPWHRVEVFNAIRQLSRMTSLSQAIAPADARALIRRMEADVRCGYLVHMEADWIDVTRRANEISAESGFRLPVRASDLLHVAYAVELGAEAFVSLDSDQLALADAAGLEAMNPAGRKSRAGETGTE